MVVAGSGPSGTIKNVEVINPDSTSANSNCFDPKDYPIQLHSCFGTYINDKPMFCVGYTGQYLSTCYTYDKVGDDWTPAPSMTYGREYGYGARLNDTHWYVGGGKNDQTKAEIYDTITNNWNPEEDLPSPTYHHVMVAVNSTSIITQVSNNHRNYRMYDTITKTWATLAPSKDSHGNGFGGMVTRPDGTRELVIAGGYSKTTEVYSLSTDTWSFGPHDIPSSSSPHDGEYVPFRESFLVIGGKIDGSISDKIFYYNPDTSDFDLLAVRLSQNLGRFGVAVVPFDFFTCA